MALRTIRLSHGSWQYDESLPLGKPGGHAEVFEGQAPSGEEIAVKRMRFDAENAARREVALARELFAGKYLHVLAPLDAGEDAEAGGYYIVMPRAEYSLDDYVAKNGPLPPHEVIAVLREIGTGLQEVPQVVHRDLKPANILWFEGRWRISDYGVAKLVDEATADDTLVNAMSAAYASPEQWRYDRATAASDLYSLGCIAYFVLRGAPPFLGPLHADYREQHLHSEPAHLDGVSAPLRQILDMLLRKAPESRPTVVRTLQLLERAGAAEPRVIDGGLSRLSAVIAADEASKAAAAADRVRRDELNRRREMLARSGQQILDSVLNDLFGAIEALGPGLKRAINGGEWRIQVPRAKLVIIRDAAYYVPDESFPRSRWDVVCGAQIAVVQDEPRLSRSASLWYTRRELRDGPFRWYEAGYLTSPLSPKYDNKQQPFACYAQDADEAHARTHGMQVEAYPPIIVDDEAVIAFIDRWTNLLAAAGESRLQEVSSYQE